MFKEKDRAARIAQDLRLTSDTGGPFDFIIGAYFNREKVYNQSTLEVLLDTDVDGNGQVTAADCAAGLPVACQVRNQFDQIKKSYALYSDLKYKLTDALTLRGGLRYTHDDGEQTGFRSDALVIDKRFIAHPIPLSHLGCKQDNVSGQIAPASKWARVALPHARG